MSFSQLNIHDITLNTLAGDKVQNWYLQPSTFEEVASKLYSTLLPAFQVGTFIDVGANYGLHSILVNKHNKNVHTIAVEADARLVPVMKTNFKQNDIKVNTIVSAIASATSDKSSSFSLNPASSLDNRVNMSSWEKTKVQSIAIDDIADIEDLPKNIYIKIDTQGSEPRVISGSRKLLETRQDWIMKLEFAEDWIASQSINTAKFFEFLVTNFCVVEMPPVVPYKYKNFDDLFTYPLTIHDQDEFISYVSSLNINGRGWGDLLVKPRKEMRKINWTLLDECLCP